MKKLPTFKQYMEVIGGTGPTNQQQQQGQESEFDMLDPEAVDDTTGLIDTYITPIMQQLSQAIQTRLPEHLRQEMGEAFYDFSDKIDDIYERQGGFDQNR